ncbi:peptide ABC transporter substrate-binding protein [Rhodobacteraceae bacterium WD3A24]|nr:peptide ABC transporter substrate-binding protein [Rhodobacteraceae bacterium WD3A24]
MTFDRLPKARRSAALLGGAAVALALGAASAGAETIRWARVGDALTLDPHAQNEGPTHALNHHIYETLVGRATDGTLTPRLATEWGIHPDDDTIWVFELREGVTFHDGTPFEADDVVFSLERAMAETSDMKGLHGAVESVEAVDEHTVHVQMEGPAPLYVQNLTNTFIMNREWAEEHDVEEPQDFAGGEESYAVRNANGTGPYTVAERDPEVRTVLEYFGDHWAETPEVSEIIYTPIAEDATRVAALLSGEVDIVQDVPVQDIQRLQETDGITVETGPENRVIFFAYDMGSDELQTANVEGNPFADPLVREAMHLALDRDAIRQVVMRGQSLPTGVTMPPFVNGWTEELDEYPQPDYERAQELLAEAGYPDGFEVTLHTPNDRYLNDEAISQAYVGMLDRIGIDVNLVSQTRSLHFPLIQNRETDFYLLGWGVPTFDSQYIFDFLVHSTEGARGGWNGSRYSNPELDQKIEALATETDLEARNEMIAEIWAQVQEDRVFLPVHNQLLAYAMREGISLPVHPENQPSMTDVSFED